MADISARGITEANNANIWKLFTDFYSMAEDGTEVWLMAFAPTVTLTDMLDKDNATGYATKLIIAAGGRIRGLLATRNPSGTYNPTVTNGLDADVHTAVVKAHALAGWAKEVMAPIFVVIEGKKFSGTASQLTDYTQASYNRVAVLIGDTVTGGDNACMGLLGGRIASTPVQRHIGRVKDGPIASLTAYIKDTTVELADPESIHNKGYITLRKFVGRGGYFFSDDVMCTLPTDDYHTLTARRTIDKAYRIAYDAMLNELLDEMPVNDDGSIAVTRAKSIETRVENAVINSMTVNGELGNDPGNPNDTGVSCFIDHTQNLVATGQLDVTLQVKPFGYARYIEVSLGFKTITS
jgi:hypothetical protein